MLANLALFPMKLSVKSVLGFDVLGGNKPELKTSIITIPAMYMIGDSDILINLKSFKAMYEKHKSIEKKFRIMME